MHSCLGLAQVADANAADQLAALRLDSPLDYQVVQRKTRQEGVVPVRGRAPVDTATVEVQLGGPWLPAEFSKMDPTRTTLPGGLYRQYLEQLIRESRREIGCEAPWFVAQVSYHVPADEASPDIRAAQRSLWEAGIAIQGPDSDALKGKLRERNGQGVHFSGKGLCEHAAHWAEKVAPWLKSQLTP